jgi:hypothetical protein
MVLKLAEIDALTHVGAEHPHSVRISLLLFDCCHCFSPSVVIAVVHPSTASSGSMSSLLSFAHAIRFAHRYISM